MIIPLPDNLGVGFCTTTEIDKTAYPGWRVEEAGIYTNFHASYLAWDCGFEFPPAEPLIIDGFSPNLNKQLHIGHLRNLAAASSLSKILYAKPVAMLGASLGVISTAQKELTRWFKLARYSPELYYDVLLPIDVLDNIEDKKNNVEDTNIHGSHKVWKGPNGDVIVVKSDGLRTYAYHDLVFAKLVKPDFYITGCEQQQHFNNLGLSDKHIPMGLVLGQNGKKMQSRNGESLSAQDALLMVQDQLLGSGDLEKLAWNILAWNFLSVKTQKDIKFDPDRWSNPDSPGLYITYTYARIWNAIESAMDAGKARLLDHHSSLEQSYSAKKMIHNIASMAAPNQVKSIDYELACTATYYPYYLNLAYIKRDPSWLAHFAFRLSKKLNQAYHYENIVDGRNTFQTSIDFALTTLRLTIEQLGMYPLTRV